MGAPRRSACSSSSSVITAHPSARRKPSRSRSKGREALVGASFRRDQRLDHVERRDDNRRDRRVHAAGDR